MTHKLKAQNSCIEVFQKNFAWNMELKMHVVIIFFRKMFNLYDTQCKLNLNIFKNY